MVSANHIFRALHHRNYRLYFIGQSISVIGTWMQRMAVNWLIYSITHSAVMLGVAGFAEQIPTFILSPYGGVITDRYNRYKVLLVTQCASMVQASLLAVLVLSGHYTVAEIILLSTLLGTIKAFDIPSRQSLMVELVEGRNDLSNAIALNSSMVNTARFIGPAIAGVLLVSFGEGICFLLNAVSFIAVIACLLMMKITPRPLVKKKHTNAFREFREGFAYLRQSPALAAVIGMLALVSLVGMPYDTLLPIFAKDIFKGNASVYGWLSSVSGVGAVVGAVYLASLKSDRYLYKIIAVAAALFGISLLLFAATPHLGLALFFIMISGFGRMAQTAASNTYLQTTVSNEMMGRMLSFYVMAFQGMQPIGSFLVGNIAHWIGAPYTIMLEGAACILVAAGFMAYLKKKKLIKPAGI